MLGSEYEAVDKTGYIEEWSNLNRESRNTCAKIFYFRPKNRSQMNKETCTLVFQ